MSDLDEPRIRCPNCGRNVPAMKYCIYCGAQLPPVISAPERLTISPPLRPPLSVPPEVPPPKPYTPQVSVPPVSVGLESEVSNLMSNIATLYERKVSLLSLFQSGEILEGIFLKLYNEYSNKLNDALNARIRKIGELRSKLDERSKRLDEVTLSLEELRVRQKIGELDLNTYAQRAEKLKIEERELGESVKNLKVNLDRLGRMFGEKKIREIRDLEIRLKTLYESLENRVKEGKMAVETWNIVKPDIDEMLVFFDSLTSNLKEEERKLREQLETLQARYKLGEVPLEEYEKRKRELQEEIDKVWE